MAPWVHTDMARTRVAPNYIALDEDGGWGNRGQSSSLQCRTREMGLTASAARSPGTERGSLLRLVPNATRDV